VAAGALVVPQAATNADVIAAASDAATDFFIVIVMSPGLLAVRMQGLY
jgi:hypothetical protein